jgi:hypothetical protein
MIVSYEFSIQKGERVVETVIGNGRRISPKGFIFRLHPIPGAARFLAQ